MSQGSSQRAAEVEGLPVLSRALLRLVPQDLEVTELPITNLPLYSPDFDDHRPPEPQAAKEAVAGAQTVLFVTPECNRSTRGR